MRTRHQIGLAAATATVLVLTLALGTVAGAGGRTFSLGLSSAVEVPPPNDAATGSAWLQLNPGLRQVCFEISWEDVAGTVVASHIHVAPEGVAGPVVVPLFSGPQQSDADGNGSASGCVSSDLTPAQLADIVAHPEAYYLNVHSSQNAPGAIRAQLG